MNGSILTLGYSSCPNDTFIFKAMARELIDLGPHSFDIRLEDVETLNQNAALGKYQITKLSVAALGKLLDRYALLRSGAALGNGCGPLIIARPGRWPDDRPCQRVAVPGMGTTAYHLFRFYMDDLFPGQQTTILPMPFEKVMPAVLADQADLGVIIHEGRFVFQGLGLSQVADLGQWWEENTGLPIPLGCIALRRDLGPETAQQIQQLIADSIDHAFAHPEAARDYIDTHAQELDPEVIQQHIDLYVNDFSRDLGPTGEKAIALFFEKAARAGLMPEPDQPLFIR